MELAKVEEVSEKPIGILFHNPGYSHIAQKILWHLDHNSQLSSRLVCHSWKTHIDKPHFWIKKCYPSGRCQYLRDAWIKIANEMMMSDVEKYLQKILMHKYAEDFIWDQVDGCNCKLSRYLSKQPKDIQNSWEKLAQKISTLPGRKIDVEQDLKKIMFDKFGNKFENVPPPDCGMMEFLKALETTFPRCGICIRRSLRQYDYRVFSKKIESFIINKFGNSEC